MNTNITLQTDSRTFAGASCISELQMKSIFPRANMAISLYYKSGVHALIQFLGNNQLPSIYLTRLNLISEEKALFPKEGRLVAKWMGCVPTVDALRK